MEDLNITNEISNATNWLIDNQDLLVRYSLNIIFAGLILFFGIFISRVIAKNSSRIMKAKQVDITIANFVSTLLRYGIIVFVIIFALNRIGINTTSIVALIGAAGLAVGFALKDSLSNFAAGILLVTFRYFEIGDYVDVDGTAGTVLVVEIFSTTIRTYDGKIVMVPNSKILSNKITNFSQEPHRLIDTIIQVGYQSDIEEVKRLLTDILIADSRIIREKGIIVRLNALNSSSMDFMVRAWVPGSELQNATFDFLEKTKTILDNYKINIPYPQIDVHLHSKEINAVNKKENSLNKKKANSKVGKKM